MLPAVLPWLAVLAVLWLGQLWWLSTAAGSWSGYWYWRGVYRPGIQTVEATSGEYLPDHTFHPLSPSGARLAFVLSSGTYAAGATTGLWLLVRLPRRGKRRGRRRRSR